jgi:hypothetical protein
VRPSRSAICSASWTACRQSAPLRTETLCASYARRQSPTLSLYASGIGFPEACRGATGSIQMKKISRSHEGCMSREAQVGHCAWKLRSTKLLRFASCRGAKKDSAPIATRGSQIDKGLGQREPRVCLRSVVRTQAKSSPTIALRAILFKFYGRHGRLLHFGWPGSYGCTGYKARHNTNTTGSCTTGTLQSR